MNVLRKRRRRHVKKYIVIFAICGLFFIGMQLLFAGAKAYKDWDELDFDSDLNMIFVTNVKPSLSGPYHSESYDDGTAMELYYIWVDDTRIMPVSLLDYKVIDSAHVYMDAKKQFQEGRITEDAFCKYQFTGMGRLEKVSEYERLDELQQYLEEEADTKGKNIQILPYTMQIMAKDFINICGFMVFVLFCVICIVLCIIRTSTSCGEKMLVEYRKGQGDTASTIALSLTQTPAVLKVYFKNGKTYNLQLACMEDVDTVLQYIRSHFSWVTTEYSEEMLLKYKRKEYPF